MDIALSGHYTYRRIVHSVIPSIVMVLVTSVYSIVDGFFVSNFAGKSGFAATNLMWPAIMLVGSLGLMVGSGGAALISKIKGQGYPEKANRVFSMLVQFALLAGIILGAAFALLCRPVAIALGADQAMLGECVLYTRLCMLGMPGFLLQMAFQSFFMAAERPQLGTIMAIVCGVLNILLDALLVWLLGWGVAGAAIATAASQLLGGFFPIAYFLSHRNRSSLRLIRTRWMGVYIRKACSNGMSEYVGSIALNIVSIFYNLQLMHYLGEDGVAAYGIIMYISFIFAALFIGYNIGITPIIAYHHGAGDLGEQRSLLRKSLLLLGIAGLGVTLAAELLSHPLASLFVGYDPALTDIATRAIRIYMLCFLVAGWNMFVSALFTALNNGTVSAVAAFARTLLFELASVLILPLLWGIDGIWWAVNVAELLALLLSALLVLRFAPDLVRPLHT